MPAQWTAVIIGKMHLNAVTAKDLSAEVGWHPKYLSQVLNSRVNPKCAEEKLTAALERIVAQRRTEDVATYRTWRDELAKSGKTPEELLAQYEAAGMTEYVKQIRALIQQMEVRE